VAPLPSANFSFELEAQELTQKELISRVFKGVTNSIQHLHPLIKDLSNLVLLFLLYSMCILYNSYSLI
jgi:hypothetical protein